MRTRDFGFAALGRFLVVEQYVQAHQPPSAHPLPGSGVARAERHADQPGGFPASRHATRHPQLRS
jgi:hypothetical protein